MMHKHITFDSEHDEVLKQIMSSVVGVNNYSEAIRYLCTQYEPDSKKLKEAKLNSIGKEVSILLSILTNSLDTAINSDEMVSYQELNLYKEAKNLVEQTIQKNTTKKSNYKKSLDRKDQTKEIEKSIESLADDPLSITNQSKKIKNYFN